MALKDILRRCAQQLGYQDLVDNPDHKTALLDIINHAAELVYEERDFHGSLGELTVSVDVGDAIREIALPPYVGELRAVRESRENLGSSKAYGGDLFKWSLLDMRPRYQISEWRDLWRNFRLKGYCPIAANLGSGSKIGFTCQVSEPTLVQITVVGSTAGANRVMEVVEPDNCDDPTYTVNVFTSLESITKTVVSQGDFVIWNDTPSEVGVFYNDAMKSIYQIVEISQYPFTAEYTSQFRLVDVLFKKPLYPFVNDDDEFPVLGYDNIIFDKVVQLKSELQPGAEKRALQQEAMINRRLNKRGVDKTGTVRRKLMFSKPAIYNFAQRYMPGSDSSTDYIQ